MSPAHAGTPRPDLPPGPGGLYTVATLAQRLGISVVTMRGYVHAKGRPDWLPDPLPERVAGALVWSAESVEGIESKRRGPGRPRRTPDN